MRRAPAVLLVLPALLLGSAYAEDDRPAPGTHLDLVVDPGEHDFGTAGQRESLETSFKVTNRSDRAVEGIRVRADCGCNVVTWSTTRLEAGASAPLTVSFDTLSLSGHLVKNLRLRTSDHRRGEAVVPLRISIVKGVIVSPGSVTFRGVLQGTRPERAVTIKWHEDHGRKFDIAKVEVPGHEFETRIDPFRDPAEPKWGGWRIHLRFKTPPPVGMVSAEVVITTTSKERSRIVLPLSAHVSGKVWVQSRTMSFGSFRAGTERTASIKFRPFVPEVKIERPSARSLSGNLRVEVKPDPLHGEKGVWRLYATVPAERAAGSLDKEVIELRTGVPGEETITLAVRGYVLRAGGTGR